MFRRRPSTGEECLENDSVSEALLTQMKRNFYTNVPASYMEAIVDEVVPKIGVKFEDLKDVYHVKVLLSLSKQLLESSCYTLIYIISYFLFLGLNLYLSSCSCLTNSDLKQLSRANADS